MLYHRRRRRRLLQIILLLFLFINLYEVQYISHNLTKSEHATPPPLPRPLRVFIASIQWNSEFVLRTHWNNALLNLAETLGPENVFISIYESGSYDNTKGALVDLDDRLGGLGVPRNISMSNITHVDDMLDTPDGEGWIDTSQGRGLRRIPYLARLRNLSLRPLMQLAERGVVFDQVLFLNDVVFETDDVLELFNTNNGVYAAACSLDFAHPPLYYDTFALRDIQGHEHVSQIWPYFRAARSRHAMKALQDVPVTSCWNGIVAMPASPFISGLHFRGIPDSLAESHLEGSECCLIHADNPLQDGVFLNPRVRVGYDGGAYEAVHPVHKWLSAWQILKGVWVNRIGRWTQMTWIKEWIVERRVRSWEKNGGEERGTFCLVNEMQIIAGNGWAHV